MSSWICSEFLAPLDMKIDPVFEFRVRSGKPALIFTIGWSNQQLSFNGEILGTDFPVFLRLIMERQTAVMSQVKVFSAVHICECLVYQSDTASWSVCARYHLYTPPLFATFGAIVSIFYFNTLLKVEVIFITLPEWLQLAFPVTPVKSVLSHGDNMDILSSRWQ